MSKNIFGPPINQLGGRQNDTGSVARQMRYDEGRKRLQANTAKTPAKSFQGRQNQREVFAQQLARERQMQQQQQYEREQAEAKGGEKWQKLNHNNTKPMPPSGNAPSNQQASKRHNDVLQQKSKRDAAWEDKRRKFQQQRGGGSGGRRGHRRG